MLRIRFYSWKKLGKIIRGGLTQNKEQKRGDREQKDTIKSIK